MATTTTKRGLRKPVDEDYVDVLIDISNNMENLDDAVPDSRKVNGKALTSDITLDSSDTGSVPTSRKINGHALTSDVSVTASDVGLGNVNNTSDANKPISTAGLLALLPEFSTVTAMAVKFVVGQIYP